jgi:hypothetical protein
MYVMPTMFFAGFLMSQMMLAAPALFYVAMTNHKQ